ncbi:MAG: DUF1634 domain-containing protein [Gemmatimonadota bacterium]|nr:DUF1634 domain-containing protein [Gemmatimonadota bacterium]
MSPAGQGGGGWSDREVEQLIGRLLQIGVLIAAGVVVIGGAALLLQYGGRPADFRVFRGEVDGLTTLTGIAGGVAHLDSRAVVQLGLVLLIATPVARVALTLVAFLAQRDRLYVALTAVVLALLLFGLVWGRG